MRIARACTEILRHNADWRGLQTGEDGFALVSGLLKYKRVEGDEPTVADIRNMVDDCPKERFQLARDQMDRLFIRVTQGHSMKHIRNELLYRSATVYNVVRFVIHGTQKIGSAT